MTKTQTIQVLIRALKLKEMTAENAHKVLLIAGHPVSKRTVYRYLDDLENMTIAEGQIKTRESLGAKKTWFFVPGDESSLEKREILSLDLMKHFMHPGLMETRKESFEILKDKIDFNLLQANDARLSDACFHQTSFGLPNFQSGYKQLDKIQTAILEQKQIIIHELLDNPSAIDLTNTFWSPVALVNHKGVIHVGMVNEDNSKIHVVKVQDIVQCSTSEASFNFSEKLELFNNEFRFWFGVSQPTNDTIYKVEILVNVNLAPETKDLQWHHSQELSFEKEGLILKFTCKICPELVAWIRNYKTATTVLHPDLLKVGKSVSVPSPLLV